MPELPEVETIRRGLQESVCGSVITQVVVRDRRLRWPIADNIESALALATIKQVGRRGKYLLLTTTHGSLIVHLGMSGSLILESNNAIAKKHTHVEIALQNGRCLRYHDPRRFGSMHWVESSPLTHPLLRDLGPEPLEPTFGAETLFVKSRQRSVAVKNFIMNSHVVVGVGNIYASEALFIAGIHPNRKAGQISRRRYQRLAEAIKAVLQKAISAGGTTLRDYVNGDGAPGYFAQELNVYGRKGQPCRQCARAILMRTIGQRASFYCPNCQH